MPQMKINIIFIILGIILGINFFFIKKKYFKLNNSWKTEYLKKIYPESKNLKIKHYDRLECLITNLIPKYVQNKLKNNVYKALLPGPSCQQLPCNCDPYTGVPNVNFALNPLLDKKWPPCNISGSNAEYCCKSVDNYKKCFIENKISWVNNDTWEGNLINSQQKPPKLNQLWKPSLWPDYMLAINKYSPTNWNNFYNSKGDIDNTWIEIIHTDFSIQFEEFTYGVWFYKTIGSGIFINLGRTLSSLNKLQSLTKLGLTYNEIANYILDDLKIENMTYWLNGQYATNLEKEMKKYNLNINIETVTEFLKESAIGNNYNKNRLSNTGSLDKLIVTKAQEKGYKSVQFTVQPNVYTGWTTEIVFVDSNLKNISSIPSSEIRILDPNNLPLTENTDLGKICKFKFPFTCLYCEDLPASLTKEMNCKEDPTSFTNCTGRNRISSPML